MAKRRRDEFVAGKPFVDEGVCGLDDDAVGPLVASEALAARKSHRILKYSIYRLVPVTVAEVKRQAAREGRARKERR